MVCQLAPLLLGLSNGLALRSPCSAALRRRPVCMQDGRPSLWEAYSRSRGLPLSSSQPSPPQPSPPPPPCPPPPWSPASSSTTPALGEATRDGEVEVAQFQVEVTPEAQAWAEAADHGPPPWSQLGPPPPAAAPPSPPAALSLAELLWSVERESELKLGRSLDGAPVFPTLTLTLTLALVNPSSCPYPEP